MAIFDDLVAIKGNGTPFDGLVPIDAQTSSALKKIGLPSDYLEFLEMIGFGELGDASYMLYEGVVTPDEIYGDVPPNLQNILLFGDDFQGVSAGFDRSSWLIVEVDSANMAARNIAPDFQAFIRTKLREI